MFTDCSHGMARVRQILALLSLLVLAAGLHGCDGDTITEILGEDELAPPLGLRSVTGNQQVTLAWYTSNFESDFEGYIVYQQEGTFESSQSTEIPAGYVEVERMTLSSSGVLRSVLIDSLTNGTSYSFAVVAFQDDGDKISRTSNIISDTPRPDITSKTLTSASTNDVTGDDSTAGFRLDSFTVGPVPADLASSSYNDTNGTDFVHEAFDPGAANTNIRSWLAGMNGGGVQDLGFMDDLDGSDVAPTEGYAANGESVLLTVGHVYAIKTGSGRYGKIIITTIDGMPNPRITFNAAFQTKEGDPNYLPALGLDGR